MEFDQIWAQYGVWDFTYVQFVGTKNLFDIGKYISKLDYILLRWASLTWPVYPDVEEGVVHHHGEAEDSGQAAHQGHKQYGPREGGTDMTGSHFTANSRVGAECFF